MKRLLKLGWSASWTFQIWLRFGPENISASGWINGHATHVGNIEQTNSTCIMTGLPLTSNSFTQFATGTVTFLVETQFLSR